MSGELADAMLARRMKWDYQQLRRQPQRFIDILLLMDEQDGIKQREDDAKAKARAEAEKRKGRRR